MLVLGIAAAPSDRDVLYVFGQRPAMWRVDGAATARRVGATRLPRQMFGVGGRPSDYDLAIAVDPANPAADPDRRRCGVASPDRESSSAAMYRITVGDAARGGRIWATDYARRRSILDATLGRGRGARRRAPDPLGRRAAACRRCWSAATAASSARRGPRTGARSSHARPGWR